MKPATQWRTAVLSALLAAAPLWLAAGAAVEPAQARGENAQRIIQGKVVGPGGEPVPGAIVYLKDMKALTIRSFISTADGAFRFGQLAGNIDYQVWAEKNGRKSNTKEVSAFDQKKQFEFTLKMGD